MSSTDLPTAGQIVKLRERQYLVESVAPPAAGLFTPVSLACLEDDAQGERLEVLWEAELDREILDVAWDRLANPERDFDPPRHFAAYLGALRWNLVSATDPSLVQAPFRAGIEVLAYQLEPLRKALLLPRVNLFIADDVGLGKTIEAGLILRELIMRQKVRRIVIGAPANVVYQWKAELEERFGLSFVILDRDYVTRVKTERGHAANPWQTHSRFIVSHALLRDERYLAPLRLWLDPDNTGGTALQTMLVLDEAHNAAPASDGAYAVDSNFTRTIRTLAPRFEHRLFLSATPHNGLSNSFSALLEILDPLRFTRGTEIKDPKELEPIMVRRLKRDLQGEVEGFPDRQVIAVPLAGTAKDLPELALWERLDAYRASRLARLKTLPAGQRSVELLTLVGLQKFLLSSVAAFLTPLEKHLAALRAAPQAPELFDAPPPEADDDDDDGGDDEDLETRREELDQRPLTRRSRLPPTPSELAQLDAMRDLALRHASTPDARIVWLARFIRERLCDDFPAAPDTGVTPTRWNDRRLVIFTEYTTTLRYIREQLARYIPDYDDRIAQLTGSVAGKHRDLLARRFNADPATEPLRILVATDAAREGINLQSHASDLVHFDLPWNPARLEQRNGRIDRRLQKQPIVYCRYFTYEARGVDKVLQELMERTTVIARELGHIPPVIEKRFTRALVEGLADEPPDTIISRLQTHLDASQRFQADPKRPAEPEILPRPTPTGGPGGESIGKQLNRLRTMLERSEKALDFGPGELESALSVSLAMLGQPPLEPLGGGLFAMPRLDAVDASWAATLDTLRPPRNGSEESFFEWRRQPPRPIRLHALKTIDPKSVHVHLEHKVVQRLLNRFLAQGFALHELSRICLAQSADRIPRVALIGRLSLFGDGGARLHDELVVVAARWIEPADRDGPLEPFKAEGTDTTWAIIKAALSGGDKHDVPAPKRETIRKALPRDIAELQPHLQARFSAAAADARQRLRARGEAEAKDLRDIIQAQVTRLAQEIGRPVQYALDFTEEEKRQRDADVRAWQSREKSLRADLKTEPLKIEKGYEVRAERADPVGLVYLWPRGG